MVLGVNYTAEHLVVRDAMTAFTILIKHQPIN